MTSTSRIRYVLWSLWRHHYDVKLTNKVRTVITVTSSLWRQPHKSEGTYCDHCDVNHYDVNLTNKVRTLARWNRTRCYAFDVGFIQRSVHWKSAGLGSLVASWLLWIAWVYIRGKQPWQYGLHLVLALGRWPWPSADTFWGLMHNNECGVNLIPWHVHFEVFGWSSNMTSKLTSLCLSHIVSSSFFHKSPP